MNSIFFAGKEYTQLIAHPMCRMDLYDIDPYIQLTEFANENSNIKILTDESLLFFTTKKYKILHKVWVGNLEKLEVDTLIAICHKTNKFSDKKIRKEFERELLFI